MANIAQQDDIRIVDKEHGIAALAEPQKQQLKECIQYKTILNVVLETKEALNKVNVSKVIGYETDNTHKEAPTHKVYVLNTNTGAITGIAIN